LIQRINLYLIQQLIIAFLFSSIAVSFVVLFTQSFRMLSFVIDNSSSLLIFVQLMGLMIPTFLPIILPISFGVSVLFIYHKFAVDSELVVMRSAGLSPFKLAKPALILAMILIVFGGVLSIWATPAANRSLVYLQYKVKDKFSSLMIKPGVFNDISKGLTLFAQRRDVAGRLENILVHDVRKPKTPITIMAKKGQFTIESGMPKIVIFEGRRQEIDVATGHLQQLDFDRYVLDLNVLKSKKTTRQPNPRELSIIDLFKEQNKDISDSRKGKIRAEIHQRLASPFLALTFALIGLSVILVGDFNRRGMTKRVVMATIYIVVVQAAMLGLISQVAKSVWFVPVLYLVAFAPIPFCIYLLKRNNIKPFCLPLSWLGRFS